VAQTKAQRSAAAKKAARTRKRNQQRGVKSSARGATDDVTRAIKEIRTNAEKSIEAVRKRADSEIRRLAGSVRR
jgi:hypothetical protein